MKNILCILIVTLNFTSIYTESLHPSFNINSNELKLIVANLPNETAEIINSAPFDFFEYIDLLINTTDVDLRLVDKTNRLESDYIAENMINLADYELHTRYKTMMFVESAVKNFVSMSNSALEDGVDLFIASTYRSYDFQDQIFTNMKNYHGEEKAATIVAYPGASQHQLGAAVDFGSITPSYAYTEAGIWLLENGWKFGFTLSYPKGMEDLTSYMWEPWHYRYIGKVAAEIQRKYFQDVQQLFLNFWNTNSVFFIEKHIQ